MIEIVKDIAYAWRLATHGGQTGLLYKMICVELYVKDAKYRHKTRKLRESKFLDWCDDDLGD